MVKDVAETVDYYVGHLGFSLVVSVPDTQPYVWAMIKNGEVTLMLQEENNLKESLPELKNQQPGGRLTLYIDIQNIESFYKEVKEQVHIIQKLYTTFHNTKEFSIQDLNGFVLTFAEDQ
jgi:catechol 2,3-dioxygenase-like lactoylglutathione lyase family enzyme